MRIVHFSDLHAGGLVKSPRGLFDKRLFGMLNHIFRRAHLRKWERVERAVTQIKMLNPDLVVCTGDLTTISEPDEFELARQALMPLVEDKRFEFLYVPGNHDNYVPRKKCEDALLKAFGDLNENRWKLDELPIRMDFQGLRILMVNEAVPMPVFASSGELSPDTCAWLENELNAKEDEIPILLLSHFPIFDANGGPLSWRRECRNNQLLRDALHDGIIKLALCGHIHTPFVREETCGAMEVCAGSLTFTGMMSIIDFDIANDKVSQRWVQVDDDEPEPEPAGVAAPLSG